jgi:hypothetical protein
MDAGRRWLTPVTPAIWKAEIRRISVQGQPGQRVHKTAPPPPISKMTRAKWAEGEAQVAEHCFASAKP